MQEIRALRSPIPVVHPVHPVQIVHPVHSPAVLPPQPLLPHPVQPLREAALFLESLRQSIELPVQ